VTDPTAATPASRWSESLCIDAGHACLPGHFPGRPVVPGVLVLDAVVASIERRLGRSVTGFPQVKFQNPLLPGERAEIDVAVDAQRVRFGVMRGAAVIATGTCETAA